MSSVSQVYTPSSMLQREVLSAVDLHRKFVKVELESHEKRLEDLETRRSTLLKTIDHLEQEVEGIEATNKMPPTEVQPSLHTIYSSAIQKHGTDNYLFYLESSILQKRMHLALLVWENYTCEVETYPLIQELAELQSMVCIYYVSFLSSMFIISSTPTSLIYSLELSLHPPYHRFVAAL